MVPSAVVASAVAAASAASAFAAAAAEWLAGVQVHSHALTAGQRTAVHSCWPARRKLSTMLLVVVGAGCSQEPETVGASSFSEAWAGSHWSETKGEEVAGSSSGTGPHSEAGSHEAGAENGLETAAESDSHSDSG